MDVYVSREGKVKLMDFNPFGGSTLPLLYSWEELLAMSAPVPRSTSTLTCDPVAIVPNWDVNDDIGASDVTTGGATGDEAVELRVVMSPQAVRPSLRALSGAPFDLRDGSPGGSLEELFQRLSSMDARGGS